MKFLVSNNKLSGTIPENFFAQMSGLRELDLSSNNFHGTIPEGLGNITGIGKMGWYESHLFFIVFTKNARTYVCVYIWNGSKSDSHCYINELFPEQLRSGWTIIILLDLCLIRVKSVNYRCWRN